MLNLGEFLVQLRLSLLHAQAEFVVAVQQRASLTKAPGNGFINCPSQIAGHVLLKARDT